MIGHIPEMVEAGIASAKIEGRMKTIFYAATVASVSIGKRSTAIMRIPHRIGFARNGWKNCRRSAIVTLPQVFLGRPDESAQNYRSSAYIRKYDFIGIVRSYDGETGSALIEQRSFPRRR